jgi:hypothetical protein
VYPLSRSVIRERERIQWFLELTPFAVCHGSMAMHELVIGFDADDTLWHNENIFEETHERYRALLARYHDVATVDRTLFATEMRIWNFMVMG